MIRSFPPMLYPQAPAVFFSTHRSPLFTKNKGHVLSRTSLDFIQKYKSKEHRNQLVNRDPYEMGDVQQFFIKVSYGWQSNRYESKNIKKRSPKSKQSTFKNPHQLDRKWPPNLNNSYKMKFSEKQISDSGTGPGNDQVISSDVIPTSAGGVFFNPPFTTVHQKQGTCPF